MQNNGNIELTILNKANQQPPRVVINMTPLIYKCMNDHKDVLQAYPTWANSATCNISFEYRTLPIILNAFPTSNGYVVTGLGELREGWTQQMADKLGSIIQTGNYKANIVMEAVVQKYGSTKIEPYFKHITIEEIKEDSN